ncbi:MAG: hypothetical protein FRX49_02860 [Trebouxia sp. A1-2]|nr:MAG: hypothetical protein FRX49_02860 [Trebouxia sp. A1-2]
MATTSYPAYPNQQVLVQGTQNYNTASTGGYSTGWLYCLFYHFGLAVVPQCITRGEIRRMNGLQGDQEPRGELSTPVLPKHSL